ncbi:extensin family protein [Rhodophyticola sp. CCM32]|uniref:extensin-like domain-containing protein n=1 Tax=Rhodophyticola sp. CCM32 TaxID=2916397 RepID=UPI00107F1060|nr:extensin family protein [Rhodophyticola sp. CCM32]QBY02400.1 extensin family protein [Rhodophyticola sp. CCM32]
MARLWRGGTALVWAGLVLWGGWWLLSHPLPDHWNPLTPLDVAAPVTPLTGLKLRAALRSTEACFAALDGQARLTRMAPLRESATCFIDPRLRLDRAGRADLVPVETTCAIALRLTMWEHHVLQPAAETAFGQGIAALHHQSSYNCRPIRMTGGAGTRMSSHATAEAIDIRGVVLADGQRVDLLGNWGGSTPEAEFYRAARDGACRWFSTVLGPEFNRLHADHFHLQSTGWGTCR